MRVSALFVVPAVASFLLFVPVSARSSVRTIGCPPALVPSYTDYTAPATGTFHPICQIPIGTDFPTSAITGAYFDFSVLKFSGDQIQLSLVKTSYTGSVYADTRVVASAGSTSLDEFVAAANITQNASDWDYLYARVEDLSDPTPNEPYSLVRMIGVAIVR
jgi:hypothetical protein